MSHLPVGGHSPTSRSRRASRLSGDAREQEILAAAERLLTERPLQTISIDDLTKSVGISRPAFYFYFSSKDAVLLALLDRVVDASFAAMSRRFAPEDSDPVEQWRYAIEVSCQTFRDNRAVLLAAEQAKPTNLEVRQLWSEVMRRWVQRTAKAIEAERRRGAAPPGVPAQDLAVALNLMNERALFAIATGDEPTLRESDLVDVLTQVWLNAIYIGKLSATC